MCEQEFEDGVLQATRVNFLGARGIEAVVTIDHTRGNQVRLDWLLYDGHGNLVRLMSPDYTLSGFQWRGVWGEVQGSLGTGRGYCAHLGHPEDETGLVYMRARYYEPATGRFISEDPARDGVNWYLYADGNPVGKVDVDGRFAGLASILLGGTISSTRVHYDRNVVLSGLGTVPGFLAVIAGYMLALELGLEGLFFARKEDIRYIDWVSRRYGLTRSERRRLHDEISGQNLTKEEIEEIAQEIVSQRREKGGNQDEDE